MSKPETPKTEERLREEREFRREFLCYHCGRLTVCRRRHRRAKCAHCGKMNWFKP